MKTVLPEIKYGDITNYNHLVKSLITEKKAFLIADENTVKCRALIPQSPLFEIPYLVLKSGEENKTLHQVAEIWKFLNTQKATRNDVIFLLGGGVICDMGGFAASTFKRGMDFVNIPTSLLAMVDAAIGGKTGFNLSHFKNNIGSFSHPLKIFNDVRFLNTLPKNELLSGMAEVFKHAIISDYKLWKKLKESNSKEVDYSILIKKSAELKIKIVQKDPYEKNLRKSLNLGHTIGHAIESLLLEKNTPTMHGFAVAKGIIIEAFISYKLKLASLETYAEINTVLLKFFGENLNFPLQVQPLLTIMKGDKKNTNHKINFTLPISIGEVLIDQEIDFETLEKLMLEFLKNG
jgi:3-dehydroquinate synthase